MDRTVLAQGELHEVSCAVLSDGTSPADEVLELMSQGRWEDDPEFADLPPDAQIKQHDLFLVAMEFFADNGVPHNASVTMNALREGIWEFKIAKKRFSFFDTDGMGNKFSPRKCTDREQSVDPEDDLFWHVPDFERLIRIGHCFPKLGDKTTEKQIQRTLQVRWEDLNHDRKAA